MVNNFLKQIGKLMNYRICFGADPEKSPEGTIVFFPNRPDVLHCGLAGILAVRGSDSGRGKPDGDPAEALIRSFQRIGSRGLRQLLSGAIKPEDYLKSREAPATIEESVLLIKTDRLFGEIFFDRNRFDRLVDFCGRLKTFLASEEKLLEENADRFHTAELEIIYSRIVLIKDMLWTLEKDLLQNIEKIKALCPRPISPEGLRKYREINYLLNCLDRLEVRGRDSAGLQISFTLADSGRFDQVRQALEAEGLFEAFSERCNSGDLVNGSIQCSVGNSPQKELCLSFTYKTASIIGELGRNVRELRKTIRADRVFHVIAGRKAGFNVSFAHTRWASVGSITEENCHPVNNFTRDGSGPDPGDLPGRGRKNYPHYGESNWRINVVLNGDIDNYRELRDALDASGSGSEGAGLIAPELTTDTKIIPLQIEGRLRQGANLEEAFRRAVCDFEGSHAIAMQSNVEPGKTYLALRGSGQSVYVGLCKDRYVLSSELYGLVEETPHFIKMDGEKPAPSDAAVRGQIFVLDQDSAGGLSGIKGLFYNGEPCALTEADVRKAEITTRDIDRGVFPHFFLKEISEAAQSVRKTLRGKYRISATKEVIFNLGEDLLPHELKQSLVRGDIKRIFVIGHGTAAVAGTAIADGLNRCLHGSRLQIEAKRASELSGFALDHDLRDTLAIAVTQSGTTTDTNRAVSMAAERGATIIAVVNRRQSDITHKADGVFYTSDGRDIEMSVASTKAFYSQIVAGHVLALFMAKTLKTMPDETIARELNALEKIPALMTGVIAKSAEIAASVARVLPHKRYWAVVGSGPNKAAADEIRIKLSELCYKTISSDVIEDKKHIDLSSEPLIIVCASGSPEVVTGDIVKDTAIFKAHKATVVVFADEGEARFDTVADSVIALPRAPMPAPVILNTVAGHLWGYHAACHVDAGAVFLQEFKNRLSLEISNPEKKDYTIYERIADKDLHRILDEFAVRFHEKRRLGSFTLTDVNTVSDIVLLLKYAVGKLPMEDFWIDFKGGDGLSPLDLLNISLGKAIDELSRPIDAIRHQAKTVTVGTSRKEELPRGILFELIAQLGFSIRNLAGQNVLTLGRVQKSIAGIRGYTLYDVHDPAQGSGSPALSTISIRRRGGIALEMQSRAEASCALMGTKKTIVRTGAVYIGFGRSDNAPIAVIPLLQDKSGIRNLLLAHVAFNELSAREKADCIGDKYEDIRNMINEYNLPWQDAYLDRLPIGILLGESVEFIATKIRKTLEEK